MKSSKILKQARKLIESGEEDYICWAVWKVGLSNQKSEAITDFISMKLRPHISLGQWLIEEVGEKALRYDSNYNARIRQTRLNWIDWMISAYEEKGD